MKIEKNKIFTSPSDLNNFTLCKYHIKNDKLSFEKKLSKRKPNVAVSRSESIVIIIFNPNLLLTSCKKIDEMRLLNNFCKLTKFKTIL